MIVRAKKGTVNPYTAISNMPLRGRRLTMPACGLLWFLLSQRDGFAFSKAKIARMTGWDKESVARYCDELASKGHLVVGSAYRDSETGRMRVTDWTVYEDFRDNPDYKRGRPKNS